MVGYKYGAGLVINILVIDMISYKYGKRITYGSKNFKKIIGYSK